MSNKDIKKHLVGQPVFKQILELIPRNKFAFLVRRHKSDRYYKTFDSWTQLMTMLFGTFSRCDSMGEICDGMQALAGKLNHLGLEAAPAKSTAGDGLRGRDNVFFKEVYFISTSFLRSRIGYVPQDIKLFNGTLLSNISIDDDVNVDQLIKFCEELKLNRYFEKFPNGYNTILGEVGINISGGQKQLIGLARALFKRPDILLLDESTSAMDKSIESHIFAILQMVKVKYGTTIILSSHNEHVLNIANKTYFIAQKDLNENEILTNSVSSTSHC